MHTEAKYLKIYIVGYKFYFYEIKFLFLWNKFYILYINVEIFSPQTRVYCALKVHSVIDFYYHRLNRLNE